jgi:hypothetical protein
MTRPGGEADKLGNRYEGLWTVNVLLDVVEGLRSSLTVEPYDHESAGIEFVLCGRREAHTESSQRVPPVGRQKPMKLRVRRAREGSAS